MLSKTLQDLRSGEILYTWSGKLLDSAHPSVRADLVRLRMFCRQGDRITFLELPPYRPASVQRSESRSEKMHRLIFSTDPVFLIRAGPRKGRHARAQDLYRNEDAVRVDLHSGISLKDGVEAEDADAAYIVELCCVMYDTYRGAGRSVESTEGEPYVPHFLLSSRESAPHVFTREHSEEGLPVRSLPNGYLLRDTNRFYGQGVWCADPEDLGIWYIHRSGPFEAVYRGYEVKVDIP